MDHNYSSVAPRESNDDCRNAMPVEDAEAGSALHRQAFARRPVSVRLSDQELRFVVAAADARGQAPSTFVRLAALSAAGRPLPAASAQRDALAQETARAVGQLGRIGSLLNQIARVANATGRLGAADVIYAYDRVARELSAVREALLKHDRDGRSL